MVQSGKINVFISNADGSVLSLKIVKPGESVTSLLSFTDVLTVSSALKNTANMKRKYKKCCHLS